MCIDQTGKPRHRSWLALLVVVTLACPLGCSEKQRASVAAAAKSGAAAVQSGADKAVSSARKLTDRAVTTAKEQLPETGKAELQMSPAIAPTAAANVEVIAIGDGRDNVLQIASYNTAASPTAYPSLLIRGKTEASNAASLSGKTVACELFVRSNANSPIVMTQMGTPVKITFGQFDPQNKTLSATVGSAPLIASDDSSVSINGGTIVAVISNGGSGT